MKLLEIAVITSAVLITTYYVYLSTNLYLFSFHILKPSKRVVTVKLIIKLCPNNQVILQAKEKHIFNLSKSSQPSLGYCIPDFWEIWNLAGGFSDSRKNELQIIYKYGFKSMDQAYKCFHMINFFSLFTVRGKCI